MDYCHFQKDVSRELAQACQRPVGVQLFREISLFHQNSEQPVGLCLDELPFWDLRICCEVRSQHNHSR